MRNSFLHDQVRPSRGFTFLEIILVVAIIGILTAIVGPRLVGRSRQAKVGATRAQINNLQTALQQYEIDMGEFPSTNEGLKALVKRPSGVDEDVWQQYMDRVPKDAWQEPFAYTYPSNHNMDYDIASKGPDRQDGTEDDISNWGDIEDES